MLVRNAFRRRGFVLIVALGILGVLGLLAATFATLSRVERAVSNSYVDKVRARLLAQSGIERSLASIRARSLLQAWDDPRNDWFWREMLDAPSGTLTYTPEALALWAPWVPSRAYGKAPRSLRQSLDEYITSGTPNGASFPDPADPARSVSGRMPGTYETGGDLFIVGVRDAQGMLYINDQSPDIIRLLDNLGIILGIDGGGFKLGTLAGAVAKARGKPFANKAEVYEEVFVKNLPTPAEARLRFDVAKHFITCHAWVDYTTMHFGPKPPTAYGPESPDGIEQAGTASRDTVASSPFVTSPLYTIPSNALDTYASVPSTSIYPVSTLPGVVGSTIDTGGGFTQFKTGSGSAMVPGKFGGTKHYVSPRAPININTCSKEVLTAMIWGLTATFQEYDHAQAKLTSITTTFTRTQAEAVAGHIISGRFTFGETGAGAYSYNDFMHFEMSVIDTIPDTVAGIDKYQLALLRAMFNPNSNIRKLNPDLLLVNANPETKPIDLVHLDKSDITVKSTEATFSSMGFYEIESIGRVYNSGKIMAEESVETVVKVFDVLRYTTQEQFEKDRQWLGETTEGDLLSEGYPPVVSMPEYPYNAASNPNPYKSTTGDVTWAADYDGYLILNGPAKVKAGTSPSSFASCKTTKGDLCRKSNVAGFHQRSIGWTQAHAAHAAPRHPEYDFSSPNCRGVNEFYHELNSLTGDAGYTTGFGAGETRPYQIFPTGNLNVAETGLFEGGADLQPFGIYVNYLKRKRYQSYWADELPGPDYTVEFHVKPEIDHWNWGTALTQSTSGAPLYYGPCSRMHLFGVGAPSHGLNAETWCYVQGSRVFLDLYFPLTGKHYILFADHQWKAHTWHHVEFSVIRRQNVNIGGEIVDVPANAMLFVDGVPASSILSPLPNPDVNSFTGKPVTKVKALVLPADFVPATPNSDVGTGPRMTILSKLQNYGGAAMTQPSYIGTLDNLVIHHWRSHDEPFTPRNRFHSMSYYAGKSGTGFAKEKAGVYKKRLTHLESICNTKDVTVGTLTCTHYHPYHVHLEGHDGGVPAASFGHITPTFRFITAGNTTDIWYYDGCAGLPLREKITAGSELYYIAWFEVASLVPVTMSPILCDFSLTYFTEPKTYYRLSSSEAK